MFTKELEPIVQMRDWESLNQRGLAQCAFRHPETVYPLAERVMPFLSAQEARLRGLDTWVYALMRNYKAREGPWDVSDAFVEKLKSDDSKFEMYFDGDLPIYTVSELLGREIISFWSEVITGGEYAWSVTVASSSKGICWTGLGSPEVEEKELRAWVKRWAPKATVVKNRIPNEAVLAQLKEYFAGTRQVFVLPLDIMGTLFQKRVWEELIKIPYGETRSYSEIAYNVGNPKGQRAVGLANNKNPIGIIIPCHRVIGKKGELVGYAEGVQLKERLLSLENRSKAFRGET